METTCKFLITQYKTDSKAGLLTALIEDGRVAEISLEPTENPSLLGNIYVGRVKNLAPQINAAFVEIADGVICYYSLQENPKHLIVNRRHPDAKKPLVEGDEIIVQVNREAVKTKSPTVTSNLNFPGKYLVLTSGITTVGVSSKLPGEERERLLSILRPLCDGSFGVIARTNAAGADEMLLTEELLRLKAAYLSILEKGPHRTCFSRLSQEEPAYLSSLRGIPKGTLTEIITDDPAQYQFLQEYLPEVQPEDAALLRFSDDTRLPLIKLYNLEKVLEDALKERVWLKSGGYLVIQPTEALIVVDVNTGKYEGGKKQQQTFRKINREAAIETAHQLRLRNLSGIIIIDFIDMEKEEDRQELMMVLAQELKKDPVKTVLVDMTKLHLVELTRKKIRKNLIEQYQSL